MEYGTKSISQAQAMKKCMTMGMADQRYLSLIVRGDKKSLHTFKATAKKTIRIKGAKEVSLDELRYVQWFNGNKIDIIPLLFTNIKHIMFRVDCAGAWNKAVGVNYLALLVYENLKKSSGKNAWVDVIKYVATNMDRYTEMIESYDVIETLCNMRNTELAYAEELVVAALLMQGREEALIEVVLNIMYAELEFTRIGRHLEVDKAFAGESDDNISEDVSVTIDDGIYNRIGEIAKMLSTDSTAALTHALIQKWYCDIVEKYNIGQDTTEFNYSQNVYKAFKSDKSSNLKNYVEGKIDGKELVRLRKLKRKSDETSEYQREVIADSIAITDNTTYKSAAEVKKLVKGVMIGFQCYLTRDDANSYSATTDVRVAWNSGRFIFLMERVFGNNTVMRDTFLNSDELEEKLAEANKEISESRDIAKKSASQCRSAEKKVRNLEELNKKQAEKIKKLDSLKGSKAEIENLQTEIQGLRQELRDKSVELSELNKTLEKKSGSYSKLSKRQKKVMSELSVYKNILGELEIVNENECCAEQPGGETIENMIEALNNFKIMFCGGVLGVEKRLAELGLNNIDIIRDMGDTKRGQKFDILVIFTDFVSHKLVYSMCDSASKIGAEKMYYQGTNLQKMIRSIYETYVGNLEEAK